MITAAVFFPTFTGAVAWLGRPFRMALAPAFLTWRFAALTWRLAVTFRFAVRTATRRLAFLTVFRTLRRAR